LGTLTPERLTMDLVEANLLERHGRGRGTWYQPTSRARTLE